MLPQGASTSQANLLEDAPKWRTWRGGDIMVRYCVRNEDEDPARTVVKFGVDEASNDAIVPGANTNGLGVRKRNAEAYA